MLRRTAVEFALYVGMPGRMDAISMLKDDHEAVEQLFRRFERAGDRAFVEKRSIVDRIIEELSVHAAIEEQLFYPAVRATVPDADDLGIESLEEHHVVKWVLSELDGMSPEDERFDAKVTVLINNVRQHVDVEEGELFPMVRDELGRKALSELGEAMAAARKIAPTHPHPRAPDTPPGNLVVGTAAGVADRIADMLNGLAQGGVTAIGDIIATVLRRDKPRVSPRGAKVARSTATQVRSTCLGCDRGRHRGDAQGEARQRADGTHRPGHGVIGQGRRRAHRACGTARRHQHRTSRKGRGQGNGHLCPQVGEADSNHRQARRDHHWPHGSQGSHEYDQDRPARSTRDGVDRWFLPLGRSPPRPRSTRPSTGPAAAVCPPDMTDARPRVVELWDGYGQLGIDDVPIASRACRVLRVLPVLEHGTDARVGVLEDCPVRPRSTGPEPPTGCGGDVALWPERGNEDLGQERQVALLGPPRDLGDAGGVDAHDGEAELAGRGPDGSALPA